MEHDSKTEGNTEGKGWERQTLIKLANSGLLEQRRARRWGIFFKLLTFVYLTVLLVMVVDIDYEDTDKDKKHTALVELKGVIFAGEEAGSDIVIAGLRAAFKDKNTKGVLLRINSPGGSPVQAGYIYDEIKRLRKKYPDILVYAVIADIAASGGYYVAAATDKIYADKASIVGSIGVRMDSFGFVDTIEKLGIERRLLTAGEHKALLDPFLPLSATEQGHVQRLLNEFHGQFIDVVKQGRGDRLQDDERLYSGLVWSGEESVKLGLVDAIGSAGFVSREVIGAEEVKEFTKKRDWLERFADRIGVAMTRIIETRFLQPGPRY
ncbi:MAG: S49 family peptidase [Pseudomonadota bacterium]